MMDVYDHKDVRNIFKKVSIPSQRHKPSDFNYKTSINEFTDKTEIYDLKHVKNAFKELNVLASNLSPSEFSYSHVQRKNHIGEDMDDKKQHISQKASLYSDHSNKLVIVVPKLQISDINEDFLDTHGIDTDSGERIIEELRNFADDYDHTNMKRIFNDFTLLAQTLNPSDFNYIPERRKECIREDTIGSNKQMNLKENVDTALRRKLVVVISKLTTADISELFLNTHGINADCGMRIINDLAVISGFQDHVHIKNVFKKLCLCSEIHPHSEFIPIHAQGKGGIPEEMKFNMKYNNFLTGRADISKSEETGYSSDYASQVLYEKNVFSSKLYCDDYQGRQGGERPYTCNHCDKSFKQKKTLVTHLLNVEELQYQCNYCSKVFKVEKNLKAHLIKHVGQELYQCNQCNKAFSRKETLRTHMKIHYVEKLYQCIQCLMEFSSKGDYTHHLKTHTGKRVYQCAHCDKFFKSKRNRDIHLMIYTGEKIYKCHHCHEAFSLKLYLNRHLMTHIDGTTNQYQCNICDKAFARKASLINHQKNHNRVKRHQCTQCDKAFIWKGDFNRHQMRHTGERTYQCNICNKAFVEKGSLNYHMRRHNKEKPYHCNQCDKAFPNRSDLNRHYRTHTKEKPYQCSHCDLAFSTNSHLNRHLKAKAGSLERRYPCSSCDKAFFSNIDLERHMRTHTKEKTYQCSHCEMAFALKGNLNRHLRTRCYKNQ